MLRVGSLLVRAGVALRGLCSSLSEELQGRTGTGERGHPYQMEQSAI